MREFWREQGFIELHSPKLMGSASESGAELFKVDYFDRTAYLAQSPQFYKQMAMAAGLREGVRDRARVPRQPVVHLTSRHRVHERGRGDLVDRLPRGRDGLRGALAGARAGGHDRASTASRSARPSASELVGPDGAVPAGHPRAGQAAAARGRSRAPRRGPRPRPAERAGAVGADPRARRPRVRVRDRLPHDGAALLPHAPPRRSDSDEELRPALAGHRAHHRRPARAPLRAPARAGPRQEGRRRARSSTTSTSSATARRPTAASASGSRAC